MADQCEFRHYQIPKLFSPTRSLGSLGRTLEWGQRAHLAKGRIEGFAFTPPLIVRPAEDVLLDHGRACAVRDSADRIEGSHSRHTTADDSGCQGNKPTLLNRRSAWPMLRSPFAPTGRAPFGGVGVLGARTLARRAESKPPIACRLIQAEMQPEVAALEPLHARPFPRRRGQDQMIAGMKVGDNRDAIRSSYEAGENAHSFIPRRLSLTAWRAIWIKTA